VGGAVLQLPLRSTSLVTVVDHHQVGDRHVRQQRRRVQHVLLPRASGAAVQVQSTPDLPAAAQRHRHHRLQLRLQRGAHETRPPPVLGGQVGDDDGVTGVHRVAARTQLQDVLQLLHLQGQLIGVHEASPPALTLLVGDTHHPDAIQVQHRTGSLTQLTQHVIDAEVTRRPARQPRQRLHQCTVTAHPRSRPQRSSRPRTTRDTTPPTARGQHQWRKSMPGRRRAPRAPGKESRNGH